MRCPKCGSEDVNVVMDTSQNFNQSSCLRTLGRWFLVYITVGLWLLVPKRVGYSKSKVVGLCQNCGKKFRP